MESWGFEKFSKLSWNISLKKEDLIISSKNKLKVNEKELKQSTSSFNKMMICSKNQNYILSNTKVFGDKHGIGYINKVSNSTIGWNKFVKVFNQNENFMPFSTNLRHKFFVFIHQEPSSKLNPSTKASISRYSSDGFLPLSTTFLLITIMVKLDTWDHTMGNWLIILVWKAMWALHPLFLLLLKVKDLDSLTLVYVLIIYMAHLRNTTWTSPPHSPPFSLS